MQLKLKLQLERHKDVASRMFGYENIEKQSNDKSLIVNQIYVSKHTTFREKWYLAMTIDRAE